VFNFSKDTKRRRNVTFVTFNRLIFFTFGHILPDSMSIPSKLTAMVNARCPHCHDGRLFKYKWWNVFNFAQMHEHCPSCDVRYEVEPGFFYGAMYISYAFTVGIMLVGGILVFNFLNDPPAMGYIVPITSVSLLAVPFNFRTARVLFIHWFSGLKYDPSAAAKHENS
jgi:uncharacterized protein (DUF983 family)